MRKNIGIDYDGTFTDNPECWSGVIRQLLIFGYSVYCVSARSDNPDTLSKLSQEFPSGVTILLTSHFPKKKYCESIGVHIDIWIDNNPMSLFVDDRMISYRGLEMLKNNKCRLCHSTVLQEVIDFGGQPIGRHLLSSVKEKYLLYPIVLMRCANCSFLQLRDCIDPKLIYTRNTVPSVWKNQSHLDRIVELILGRDGVSEDSSVLEIGSNDCSFLSKLYNTTPLKKLVGVDLNIESNSQYIKELKSEFNVAAADFLIDRYGKFDVVICRHTLEHITDLQEFGDALKRVCHRNTYVFIEVPDFDFNLTLSDYSGIWEEHCNYFTLITLSRYLSRFGFDINYSEKFNYSGQSMLVMAKYTGCHEQVLSDYPDKVSAFQNNWPQYKKRLKVKLASLRKPIALYGCGARGVSLINLANLNIHLDYIIDDQEEKQYKFVPGTKLQVESPDRLTDANTCLLAVNAENEDRVVSAHPEFKGKWYSILPISKTRTLGI